MPANIYGPSFVVSFPWTRSPGTDACCVTNPDRLDGGHIEKLVAWLRSTGAPCATAAETIGTEAPPALRKTPDECAIPSSATSIFSLAQLSLSYLQNSERPALQTIRHVLDFVRGANSILALRCAISMAVLSFTGRAGPLDLDFCVAHPGTAPILLLRSL